MAVINFRKEDTYRNLYDGILQIKGEAATVQELEKLSPAPGDIYFVGDTPYFFSGGNWATFGGGCPCEVYFDAEFINNHGILFPPYPSGAEGIQLAKNVLSAISEGTDWHNIGLHLSGEANVTETEAYVKFSNLSTVKSGDDIIFKRYVVTLGGNMNYFLPISYNSEQLDMLMDFNEQMDGDGLGRVIFVNPDVGVSLGVDSNGYLTCYLCTEETARQSTSYAYVVDESGHCYEVSYEYVMNYQDADIYRITNISETQHTVLDYKAFTLPYSDVTKFIGTYITAQGTS